MVYHVVQSSPWETIFGVGGLFLCVALMVFAVVSKMANKTTFWVVVAGSVVIIGSIVGVVTLQHQNVAENNARFSQQLMDEYYVMSSQSLYEIGLDFQRFDESKTVFTQDGKETPVFIKLIQSDDKKITLAFTVIDDKALYPKPTK